MAKRKVDAMVKRLKGYCFKLEETRNHLKENGHLYDENELIQMWDAFDMVKGYADQYMLSCKTLVAKTRDYYLWKYLEENGWKPVSRAYADVRVEIPLPSKNWASSDYCEVHFHYVPMETDLKERGFEFSTKKNNTYRISFGSTDNLSNLLYAEHVIPRYRELVNCIQKANRLEHGFEVVEERRTRMYRPMEL